MARGRRIHHHGVPRRPPALLPRGLVPDLADGHELLETRRRRHEVLVDAARENGGEQPLHRDDEPEILLERGAALDRDDSEAGRDGGGRPRRAARAEQRRQPPLVVHLDGERAAAAAREQPRQRRGDRRLADTALPDDEVQPAVERGADHGYAARRKSSETLVPPKPKELDSA